MTKRMKRLKRLKQIASFFLCFFVGVVSAEAANNKDFKGWEKDSAYNKMYDPKERDTIKGRVIKFKEITPLPGMSPGTAIIVEEGKDEKILVHVCPESYASPKETGIKKGDKVKIKGSWVEIDDEFVFVAAKIKKGDSFVFKVRKTSDGTPFWAMPPDQLAYEKANTR